MTTSDDIATIDTIDTIYGHFTRESKRRLDLTFDYEAAEIAGFRQVADLVRPTLMLDIGANIGVYAVHLAGVPSLRRVLAFEPAPGSFRLLEQNLALQDDARLAACNEALSDREGSARFVIFGATAGNNAIADTAIASATVPEAMIEVPTARLDDRAEAAGETFLAKIDVEGHELQMLAGATGFLRANAGLLQVEAFDRVPELDALLGGLGYARIFRMKDDYYYANLVDPALRGAIQEVLFGQVAVALHHLQEERRRRRAAIRACRALADQLRYAADPVIVTA